MPIKKQEGKIIEIGKDKPRAKEETFFIKFSDTQLNATLLLILSATFLMQGTVKYFESADQAYYIRPWFTLVILALTFLVSSIMFISFGGVMAHLKTKRYFNLISFCLFTVGFFVFLSSLILLLVIL